jgi:nicotinate-nucleotide pyrophosphorylase (carboxylating)
MAADDLDDRDSIGASSKAIVALPGGGVSHYKTAVPEQPSLYVLPNPARTTHDPIAIALAEDIGRGDLTSRYFVGLDRRTARLFVKEPAVAAGVETAAEVFRRVDPQLEVSIVRSSGSPLERGQTVMEVTGSVRSILTGERVALNFLQQLSGVATLTRRYVDAAAGTKARILDTRKTTPGLRALEKAAVVAGGGQNHRFGLFDMVLVKDNHLLADPELNHLQEAIRRCRADHPNVRIEIEADTLDQVRRFLTLMGVDVILLDNMSNEELTEAVKIAGSRVQLEASGGVTLQTVAGIAATGVDFISVGALTHSAPAVDYSLELA